MYALVVCTLCGRARIIDCSKTDTTCPYCDCTVKTTDLRWMFRSEDQSEVREALNSMSDFMPPDKEQKRKRIAGIDPYSSMIYDFEHASDLDEKMTILAKGLTACKGTFTIDDVADVVGWKHAEKYVGAMMDRCYIAEIRPGIYKG